MKCDFGVICELNLAMEISVIVPIYKAEKYIERCLRSLFGGSKIDGVEFILINDATPDRSMVIAREVASHYELLNIIFIENRYNCGVSMTRCIGVEAAHGEYIIQIDSDDWCEADMLEQMYCVAMAEDADIVIADYFDCYNDQCRYSKQRVSSDSVESIKDMLDGGLNCQLWNKLIRRRLYIDHNIHHMEGYKIGEDMLAGIKLIYYASKISYIPRAFTHYMRNPDSITNNLSEPVLRDWVRVCRAVESFFVYEGIATELEESMQRAKMHVKFHAILVTRGDAQSYFVRCFPEVIPINICRSFKFGLHNKIAYLLAIGGMLPISNLIFNIASTLKRGRLKG